MSTWTLWRLVHGHYHCRHRRGQDAISIGRRRVGVSLPSILAVVAFAASTSLLLTVLGGVHAFISRASADHTVGCFFNVTRCDPLALAAWSDRTSQDMATDVASTYVILAVFAAILLCVPIATLAAAAARLAAGRRDARLATLRLIGASTGQVVRLTAFESSAQAFIGAWFGVVGYIALMPLVMLLPFQNQRFTFAQLWVGVGVIMVTVAAITLLALGSSLITLRRVAITPLGVSAKISQPLPSRWRVAVFVIAMAAALSALGMRASLATVCGIGITIAVVCGVFAGMLGLMNLVGTWMVACRARHHARHPKTAARMLAARRILADPKRAWRNVSGVALAVFIAGVTSICGVFATVAVSSGVQDTVSVTLFRDIGLGGVVTLAFAAVLASVSSGIMQAGSVYDQADHYRALVWEGADEGMLRKARFEEVMLPLRQVVTVSAGCSMMLMLPMFGAVMMRPETLVLFAAGIGLCFGLVSVGTWAANRVASGLQATDYRADD